MFLSFDLDNFKTLNDTLGHKMGDQALMDVADIMRRHFREYDILCRMGGDEFAVLMMGIPENALKRNVTSLLRKLNLTYSDGIDQVTISASAGAALFPSQGTTFSQLYQKADEALYEAKKEGKNTFRVYTDDR